MQAEVFNKILDDVEINQICRSFDLLGSATETNKPVSRGEIAIVVDRLPLASSDVHSTLPGEWAKDAYEKYYPNLKLDYKQTANSNEVSSNLSRVLDQEINLESEVITRGEIAQIIYDAYPDKFSNFGKMFSDHRNLMEYKIAIYSLRGAGIIAGYEDNTFRPDSILTRTELAVILDNLSVFLDDTYDDE